ncbi:MAG: hypothetical protein R3D67_07770 [Hyphomicrobiaceae bacterium]
MIGLAAIAAGVILSQLPARTALPVGLLLSIIYLVAFRTSGMLYALQDVSGNINALPMSLQHPVTRALSWCANRPKQD